MLRGGVLGYRWRARGARSVRAGYAAFVAELADTHDLDPDDALDAWRNTLGEYFRGRDGTEDRPAGKGYRRATAAAYGEDAWGRAATHELETLQELPAAVGVIDAPRDRE